MTSNDAAAGLLDTLNYIGVGRDVIAPCAKSSNAPFAFQLDFASSRVWPDLPYDTSSPTSHYAPEERPLIDETLSAAAGIFRARAPKAWAFVNAELDSAMIRRSDAIDGASSSSNRELVGTCLLTNLHASPDRVDICLEALVHEAIHQHLYRLELANGPFCDLGDSGRYRSPWSGNRIPLHSLIHASLVWYGVLCLWCQLGETAVERDEALSVRRHVMPTLFGFAFIRPILDGPGFPRASVVPSILELIGRVAEMAPAAGPPAGEQVVLSDFMRSSESRAWLADLRSRVARVASGGHV